MSSTSSYTEWSTEAHVLCDYCQATCDSSVIVQTYTKYGNDESYAALRQRCLPAKQRETFSHCFVTDFQAGYQMGCHICSMLWRPSMGNGETMSGLMQKRKDFEEKNGISESVLEISCDGIDNSVIIQLCTLSEDLKTLVGSFRLVGYLVRDFQGNLHPSFSLEPYIRGNIWIVRAKVWSDPRPSPTFPVQISKFPTAKQAAALIKFWLRECTQTHENCRLRLGSILPSNMRPTRLLDVSNVNHIWLHTRNPRASTQMEYLTLSHCWPRDGKIYKLTEENQESLKRRIPLDQLTQTLKDAIAITNALGFRYLWIDSLCIIQDSPQDWAIEADRMMHVYGNAALNLVACGPSGVTMFEPRNPLRYYPCRISTYKCSFYVQPLDRIKEDIPAFQRGWIVQERMLSRRNIYFGMKSQMGEMTWECFQGNGTEMAPEATKADYEDLLRVRFIRDTQHKAIFERLLDALERLQKDSADEWAEACLDFSRMWTKIVSIYTQTELTYYSDKLVAIAGMATTISLKFSSDYIAGMWMSTLPIGLLWFTGSSSSRDSLPERPAWRGAPSWSWASLDTEISGDWPELVDHATSQGLLNFHATFVDCETQPVTGRPATLGEYKSAKLRIFSVLRPIRKINRDLDEPWTDGSSEFGSNLVRSVLFLADVIIPADTSLFYLTIFRGWAVNCYQSFEWNKEEGLVLMPHLDGYVRVGYMRIHFRKQEKENALDDLLWGGGKLEMITIY